MALLSKQEYIISGKHSSYIDALENCNAFEHHWQIYVVAPLIGFIYKRQAEVDTSTDYPPSKIMLNQLLSRQDQIFFNYRLIMLKDDVYEPNIQERIKKAFSTMETDEAKPDEELFNRYLLGGIEVLYEKIIKNNTDINKILENLGQFIEELSVGNESLVDEFDIKI